MGIEIRPSGVSDQLSKKDALLTSIKEDILRLKISVDTYVDDDALTGSGYAALGQRLYLYQVLFAGIEQAINITKDADNTVNTSLTSRFGSEEKTSEDEWKQMQENALACEERSQYALNALTELARNSSYSLRAGDASRSLHKSIEEAQNLAHKAGEELSKIYSYCEETNNVYKNNAALNSAINKGLAALSVGGYNRASGSWEPSYINTSWIGELRDAALKNRTKITCPEDIYPSAGKINEEALKGLMETPFELLSEEELELLMQAYDLIFIGGQDGAIDTEALGSFLGCCYQKGEEGIHVIYAKPVMTVPRYEFLLLDTFKQFMGAYANNPSRIADMDPSAFALRNGVLRDSVSAMSVVWSSNERGPAFSVGYLTRSDYGQVGDELLAVTMSTLSIGELPKDSQTYAFLSGSGESKDLAYLMVNSNLDALKIDTLSKAGKNASEIAISTLRQILNLKNIAKLPFINIAASVLGSFYEHGKAVEQNKHIDVTKSIHLAEAVLKHDWAVHGSLSIVNGRVLVFSSLNEEKLEKEIQKFLAKKEGKIDPFTLHDVKVYLANPLDSSDQSSIKQFLETDEEKGEEND